MIPLYLAALAWILVHIVAPVTVRPALVARLGEFRYRGVFSLFALATMAGLVITYRDAPYITLWQPPPGAWLVVPVLVLAATLLTVLGIAAVNPASAAFGDQPGQALPVSGVIRITRHPMMIGTGLWALAHLLANGHLAALVLFGTLLLTVIAGVFAIDCRRRNSLGPVWTGFTAVTSRLPFVAILTGRNRLVLGELPWKAVALGLVLFVGLYHLHESVIGLAPVVP